MSLKGNSNEERIWNFLISKGLNPFGVAGLMGNLDRESGLSPINLQNTYEKILGFTDDTYTTSVDNGDYQNFVHDKAGYGIAQWTYWSRKQNLQKYAQKKGASIGDLEMQLEFLIQELSSSYKSVLNVLKTATSVQMPYCLILKNRQTREVPYKKKEPNADRNFMTNMRLEKEEHLSWERRLQQDGFQPLSMELKSNLI